MSPFDWFKKEKPLQGLTGMWGGVGSNLLGAAGGPQFGYQATGGTESEVTEPNNNPSGGQGLFKIHKFTSPGQFVISSTGQEEGGNNAQRLEVLLVGAGGGGGVLGGGAGGGGVSYLYKDNFSPGTYAVTVGTGGLGEHGWQNRRTGGQASSIANTQLTSYGGGYGCCYSNNRNAPQQISNGGGTSPHGTAQSGSTTPVKTGWTDKTSEHGPGTGNPGGSAPSGCCPCTGGGGGGGATGGGSAPNGGPAPGGQGWGPFNIFGGTNAYVSGGGGNNGYCGPGGPAGGNGGLGGGGGGGTQDTSPTNVPTNCGTGGAGYGGNNGQPGATQDGSGDGSQGGNGGTATGGGGGAGATGGGNSNVHGGEGGGGLCVFRYRVG